MLVPPATRRLKRNVNLIRGHHPAKAAAHAREFVFQNAHDAKRARDESIRCSGVVFVLFVFERNAEEVWLLFLFVTFFLRRREEFNLLPDGILRLFVAEVFQETLVNDGFIRIRRRDHLPCIEILEARGWIRNERASDGNRFRFSVGAGVSVDIDVRLNGRDARNGRYLCDGRIIKRTFGRLVRPFIIFLSIRRFACILCARAFIKTFLDEIGEALAVNGNLIEQIKLFETADRVALQAQTKRDHRDDHSHADEHAHRRQNSAQLGLTQITERESEDVTKRHNEKQNPESRIQELEEKRIRRRTASASSFWLLDSDS